MELDEATLRSMLHFQFVRFVGQIVFYYQVYVAVWSFVKCPNIFFFNIHLLMCESFLLSVGF